MKARFIGLALFVAAVTLTSVAAAGPDVAKLSQIASPAVSARSSLPAAAATSKIAFSSFRDGRFDAYVMNTDGSRQQRLTTKPNVFFPVWSPDGRKVAFPSADRQPWDGGNFDLYVMNADGSGLRRLTHDPASDVAPVWSPDGRKIAFTRSHAPTEGRGPGEFDVYVINVDGSGERNLTGDAMSGGPVWSPDGRRIAFTSGRDASGLWGSSIYVMNADGSGQRRLTRHAGFIQGWSRDGRKIAFTRGVGRGRGGPAALYIYVMNADGSGLRRLTRMAQVNYSLPSWSPDGRKILFVSERDGNVEVYVMNPDGSGRRNLTRHPGHDSAPSWSPDGRKIVFTTKRDGNFEVYVMNADGSEQRNLTRNPAPDRSPIWSPGRKGS